MDRDVDLTDYNNLASNFDPVGELAPHTWGHGNFDGDNDVDLVDYNVLAGHFDAGGYGTTAVPEPATALPAVFAMLLVSLSGKRSRNRCGNRFTTV